MHTFPHRRTETGATLAGATGEFKKMFPNSQNPSLFARTFNPNVYASAIPVALNSPICLARHLVLRVIRAQFYDFLPSRVKYHYFPPAPANKCCTNSINKTPTYHGDTYHWGRTRGLATTKTVGHCYRLAGRTTCPCTGIILHINTHTHAVAHIYRAHRRQP